MSAFDRPCPECRVKLAPDARACACGWKQDKQRRAGRRGEGPVYDMRCTYVASGTRCAYPCSLFSEGATSGWCVFHRQPLQAGARAEIVKQSESVPYAEALEVLTRKRTEAARALNEIKRAEVARQPDDPEFFEQARRHVEVHEKPKRRAAG